MKINKVSETEARIIIKRLDTGFESVIFEPPLVIYLYFDLEENSVAAHFDFGMYMDLDVLPDHHLFPGYGIEKEDSWEQIAAKKIKFELDHSFFHTSCDSNYGVLNYALCGCLCLLKRVTYISSEENNGEAVVMDWLP